MTVLSVVESSDAAAIEALIREETSAFIAGDYERWAACWLHDSRTSEAASSREFGLMVNRGWEAISASIRYVLEDGGRCSLESFDISNLSISVYEGVAWAIYDQISQHSEGLKEQETFQTCICEKVDGIWKIVFASFAAKRPTVSRLGRLALDKDRRVLWSAPETLDSLRDHPCLVISNGRLRARKSQWDKPLSEALSRAAEQHDFYEARRFSDLTGGTFRCPVILGEDEDGRVLTCLVSAKDGVTYVDIDGDGQTAARLMVAESIFGLSRAQLDLATLIVEGFGLTEAAKSMKISINTARTHLSRIYEKTGVNSQTALVRLLLSVG